MAHYLFNFVKEDAAKGPALLEQAAGFLRVRMWGIDADEPHRNALASGDLILIASANGRPHGRPFAILRRRTMRKFSRASTSGGRAT